MCDVSSHRSTIISPIRIQRKI